MMVGALATIIGGGYALSLGASGSLETAEFLCGLLAFYMAGMLGGGLVIDRRDKELNKAIAAHLAPKRKLVKKYNDVIDMLEASYLNEREWVINEKVYQKKELRKKFRHLYSENFFDYRNELEQLDRQPHEEAPRMHKYKTFWKIVFMVGIILNVGSCCYTAGVIGQQTDMPDTVTSSERSTETDEPIEWNADNVPMPHLTDGSRYVSNPDGVVTAHTEQLLNEWLRRFDDSLQIESAMVIVNHVENGDVFSVAQNLFDKYKIGKDDRGMVILLAYEDHQVRTHTGRALEANLTDVECSRLQQTYAVPFMKSDQPDSGMLYLTEAIYNTLKKKDLPLTWEQQNEDVADELAGLLMFFFMMFFVWIISGVYLYKRYHGPGFKNALKPNPFIDPTEMLIAAGSFGGSHRSGGGFGGGGFGGGGFGGGGGFSGGSSGGGGATSSW